MPLFNFVGNSGCTVNVVEKILAQGKFDKNCTKSLDSMMIALAFDRRPILGNSLGSLTYDVLSQITVIAVSILTPLRIVTIMNCANRALEKVTDAHFSPHRSTFDADTFLADFRIVNNFLVRIQRSHRMLPPLPCSRTFNRLNPFVLQAVGFSSAVGCTVQYFAFCFVSCRNSTELGAAVFSATSEQFSRSNVSCKMGL